MWNGYKQSVSLRHKQSSASALCSGYLNRGSIGVWISLFDDVNLSCAADRVYATPLAVEEDFVGVAGNVGLCNYFARFGVEHDKLGGEPTSDKQAMVWFIKRHREISKREICIPSSDYFALYPINYCHLTCIRNIRKDAVAVLF